MTLDDLKDQLASALRPIGDRIQDTPAYGQMKERFDNLSYRAQRGVVLGIILLCFAFLLSFPYASWSESQELVTAFEERRNVVREMLKVSKEAAEVPQIPMAPPIESLRGDIETRVKEANLVEGQLKNIDVNAQGSSLIPGDKSAGAIAVTIEKLNLRQVVTIGTRLTQINPSVKLNGLDITANREDARYMDAVFRLTALAVPNLTAAADDGGGEETNERGGRAGGDQ